MKGELKDDIVMINGVEVSQTDVNMDVGGLLQGWIAAILESEYGPLGGIVVEAGLTDTGRDVTVYDNDDVFVAGFEVLNWNFHTHMADSRALRIKKNLRGLKHKGIIWTYENYKGRSESILKNIPKLLLGTQYVTPKAQLYNQLIKPWKVQFCSSVGPSSFNSVKRQVLLFLDDIGLIRSVPSGTLQTYEDSIDTNITDYL